MKHTYAFPVSGEGFNNPDYTNKGMTLRDWFAGQALSALAMPSNDLVGSLDEMAEISYKLADAMLKEREKKWRN